MDTCYWKEFADSAILATGRQHQAVARDVDSIQVIILKPNFAGFETLLQISIFFSQIGVEMC